MVKKPPHWELTWQKCPELQEVFFLTPHFYFTRTKRWRQQSTWPKVSYIWLHKALIKQCLASLLRHPPRKCSLSHLLRRIIGYRVVTTIKWVPCHLHQEIQPPHRLQSLACMEKRRKAMRGNKICVLLEIWKCASIYWQGDQLCKLQSWVQKKPLTLVQAFLNSMITIFCLLHPQTMI